MSKIKKEERKRKTNEQKKKKKGRGPPVTVIMLCRVSWALCCALALPLMLRVVAFVGEQRETEPCRLEKSDR